MKYEFHGEKMTLDEIGKHLNRSRRCLGRRVKKCAERGWPMERAFDNSKWHKSREKYQVRCPDGKLRTPAEIGRMLGIKGDTIRHRIKRLRSDGIPDSEIFNKSRWYKKQEPIPAGHYMKPTKREQEILDRIPAPSELERRLFG